MGWKAIGCQSVSAASKPPHSSEPFGGMDRHLKMAAHCRHLRLAEPRPRTRKHNHGSWASRWRKLSGALQHDAWRRTDAPWRASEHRCILKRMNEPKARLFTINEYIPANPQKGQACPSHKQLSTLFHFSTSMPQRDAGGSRKSSGRMNFNTSERSTAGYSRAKLGYTL